MQNLADTITQSSLSFLRSAFSAVFGPERALRTYLSKHTILGKFAFFSANMMSGRRREAHVTYPRSQAGLKLHRSGLNNQLYDAEQLSSGAGKTTIAKKSANPLFRVG